MNTVSEDQDRKGKGRASKVMRTADQEIKRRMAKMKNAGEQMGEDIMTFARERPLATVGIAAGAAFVAGSILGSRLGRTALMLSVGYQLRGLVEGSDGSGGLGKFVTDEISRFMQDRAEK